MDTGIVSSRSSLALLSVAEMRAADRAAMDGGVSGATLMEAAGAGVVRAMTRRWAPRPTVVLCGPGNNGGDGFVVARRLRRAGARDVRLALLGSREALLGDARAMADAWEGEISPLGPESVEGAALIVDAVFGAGLSREVDGVARERRWRPPTPPTPRGSPSTSRAASTAIPAMNSAVVSGPTCRSRSSARSRDTCCSPAARPAARSRVVDIGIPDSVLDAIAPRTVENDPALWGHLIPVPGPATHKYRRGHALIVGGGPDSTGAARASPRGRRCVSDRAWSRSPVRPTPSS